MTETTNNWTTQPDIIKSGLHLILSLIYFNDYKKFSANFSFFLVLGPVEAGEGGLDPAEGEGLVRLTGPTNQTRSRTDKILK